VSKAKDRYYDEFRDLRIDDSSVNSDYITELEKKAEMFDEIVNQLSILYYGYEGINYTLKPLLFRAKKLQEAVK